MWEETAEKQILLGRISDIITRIDAVLADHRPVTEPHKCHQEWPIDRSCDLLDSELFDAQTYVGPI